MASDEFELSDEIATHINKAFSFDNEAAKQKRLVRQTQGKASKRRVNEAKANIEVWKKARVMSDVSACYLKKHCRGVFSKLGIADLVYPKLGNVNSQVPPSASTISVDSGCRRQDDPARHLSEQSVCEPVTLSDIVSDQDDLEIAMMKLAASFEKKVKAKEPVHICEVFANWAVKRNEKEVSLDYLFSTIHNNEIVGSLSDLPRTGASLLKVILKYLSYSIVMCYCVAFYSITNF